MSVSVSNVILFVTLFVSIVTLFVTLFGVINTRFLNRVSNLLATFHTQFGDTKIGDVHFKFFARYLSDLPLFIAKRVLRSLLNRCGEYCFIEGLKVFEKEHLSISISRNSFKKKGL